MKLFQTVLQMLFYKKLSVLYLYLQQNTAAAGLFISFSHGSVLVQSSFSKTKQNESKLIYR